MTEIHLHLESNFNAILLSIFILDNGNDSNVSKADTDYFTPGSIAFLLVFMRGPPKISFLSGLAKNFFSWFY